MATGVQDFPNWLKEKLKELNTDETVFGIYIQGILDSDESPEEQNEALQGILSEILENVSWLNNFLPFFRTTFFFRKVTYQNCAVKF